MTSTTLLIDLDDTLLLKSSSDVFPAYLKALSNHLKYLGEPEMILKEMFQATDLMGANTNPNKTLKQIFDDDFYPKFGTKAETMQNELANFYNSIYPRLASLSAPNLDASDFIQKSIEAGFTLAIATNPYFPTLAIEQRLTWAGFPPKDFPFAVVTGYETFHFTKSHMAYYAEVLARLGWPETPTVMIGNDIKTDIAPAQALGLATYHLADTPLEITGPNSARGPLSAFHQWLQSVPEETLLPDFSSLSANLAIMTATPAALSTFITQFPLEKWAQRPEPEEWSLTEILCHLRDVDREIHIPRFEMVLDHPTPFIQAIDADAWAEERQYIQQDGQQALIEFLDSRSRLLNLMQSLIDSAPEKPIQHTIFGPTTLPELVRIAARHDRLHIQQIYAQLNP